MKSVTADRSPRRRRAGRPRRRSAQRPSMMSGGSPSTGRVARRSRRRAATRHAVQLDRRGLAMPAALMPASSGSRCTYRFTSVTRARRRSSARRSSEPRPRRPPATRSRGARRSRRWPASASSCATASARTSSSSRATARGPERVEHRLAQPRVVRRVEHRERCAPAAGHVVSGAPSLWRSSAITVEHRALDDREALPVGEHAPHVVEARQRRTRRTRGSETTGSAARSSR